MMFGRNAGARDTAARIPLGSVGVEIGVWKGDSSEVFLRRAAHLHLVDPWAVDAYRDSDEHGGFDAYIERYARLTGSTDPARFQVFYEQVYDGVRQRFAGRPVTIHRCTSADFFATFHGLVDWVYIDGLHSFDGCLADLQAARQVVRSGGWIFGDDYGNKPGVTRAVQALGLPFETFGRNQYAIAL